MYAKIFVVKLLADQSIKHKIWKYSWWIFILHKPLARKIHQWKEFNYLIITIAYANMICLHIWTITAININKFRIRNHLLTTLHVFFYKKSRTAYNTMLCQRNSKLQWNASEYTCWCGCLALNVFFFFIYPPQWMWKCFDHPISAHSPTYTNLGAFSTIYT